MMSDFEKQVLELAKKRNPWYWPKDPWSVDLSCAQAQQRALHEARCIFARQTSV